MVAARFARLVCCGNKIGDWKTSKAKGKPSEAWVRMADAFAGPFGFKGGSEGKWVRNPF